MPLSSRQLCVLWRHHIPLTICWNPIPFGFFLYMISIVDQTDKHQRLIYPCFFLCNNNKTFRCFSIFDSVISFTSKYYHWWSYKSAATVRTTVTCLFSEPEVRIITDFWPFCINDFSGSISKNTGVLSIAPIRGSGFFPIFKNLAHSE